jgi:prolyl oligopeptidase
VRGTVTDDGRYLVSSSSRGTNRDTRILYKDLEADGPVTPLIPEADAQYQLVATSGRRFYFRTDLEAPMSRVIAVDLDRPARADWVEVLPEGEDQLASVSGVGGHLVASYLVDARSEVRVHDLEGRFVRAVELPGIGSAAGFRGRLDQPLTWYSFGGFTEPGTIHQYDVASGETSVFRAPELPYDPADFVTEQVFYRSKDGTSVPMFLTRRRDLVRDGSNPTLLYGYGGFTVAMTPRYSPARMAWLQLGGIYAVACLRGGSEYGSAWH